jgi:hypothetical protein
MKRLLVLCFAVALLAAGLSEAQSVVAPNALTTVAGTGGLNTLLRDSGNPRTYQLGIAASELTSIPKGAEIVGLSWRANSGTSTTWPPTTPATWTNYDITLAEAALPVGSFSTTFASNMKNAVQVRKGPMTIPVGAYQVTTSKPAPFTTFYADFQMPYTYRGGDLVILVTHPGSNLSGSYVYQEYSSTTVMQALATSSYNGTTGSGSSAVTTRIHYGYGPAGGVGTNGALNLVLSNNLVSPTPAPGAINLAVTNGVASAPGALFIPPTPAVAPIPLPGGNNLLIFPAFIGIVPLALDATGRWDLNLKFPAAKFQVEAQAYAADPAAKAGFVVTNAVSFMVGP